jgi:hypothetical protein
MYVIDYVFNNPNILTIAEINYDYQLILPACFSFKECDGSLFYGQFTKNFPAFYMFSSNYFKD